MTTAPTPLQRSASPHRVRGLFVLVLALVLGVAAVALVLALDDSGPGTADTRIGSGVTASDARSLPAFTGVELAGSNTLVVRVGGEQAVVVRGDDNLIDLVTTEVAAGRLVVAETGSFQTNVPMTVDVTVPSLTALELSGSGLVVVDGLMAERATIRVPGSGLVRGGGTVDQLVVDVSGSGAAQLEGLEARDVTASLSGSGVIRVTATGRLDARVSGTGTVLYGGSPETVTREVTGTGAIVDQ